MKKKMVNKKAVISGAVFVFLSLILFWFVSASSVREIDIWDWSHPKQGGHQITSVEVFDSNTALVFGSTGNISKTIDGGLTWSFKNNLTTASFYASFFFDANTGWVVGSSGVILKTSDGGGTWDRQSVGVGSGTIYDIYFANASVGWYVDSKWLCV